MCVTDSSLTLIDTLFISSLSGSLHYSPSSVEPSLFFLFVILFPLLHLSITFPLLISLSLVLLFNSVFVFLSSSLVFPLLLFSFILPFRISPASFCLIPSPVLPPSSFHPFGEKWNVVIKFETD